MKNGLHIGKDGTKRWYFNDNRHREDGPAIEYDNGEKCWYQHDKLHREDGPAVVHIDGYKAWYQHHKLHRLDGPAQEYPSGNKFFYLDGIEYSEQEHARLVKLKAFW